MPSFGLMFNDFLTSLGEETSAVTIITGCFFCALSFAGLFTNTLFKKFSIRTVAVFGGTMYFVGSLMTIFVTSVEQLMIAFSVFQGEREFPWKSIENSKTDEYSIKKIICRDRIRIHYSVFLYDIQSLFCQETRRDDECCTNFNW